MIDFSKKLQEILDMRGIKEAHLAHYMKIEKSQICGYLRGRYLPGFRVIDKMSDALNISADSLMGRSDITEEERGNDIPIDFRENLLETEKGKRIKEYTPCMRPNERVYILRKNILEALNENIEGWFTRPLIEEIFKKTGVVFHKFSVNRELNILLKNGVVEFTKIFPPYANKKSMKAALWRLKKEE